MESTNQKQVGKELMNEKSVSGQWTNQDLMGEELVPEKPMTGDQMSEE